MSAVLPDFTGNGVLAGANDALTRVAGVPISATVRVYWQNPADPDAPPVLVAATTSSASGHWRVDGLNPLIPYLVVASKPYFDDVAVSGCYPYPLPSPVPPRDGAYVPPRGASVALIFT